MNRWAKRALLPALEGVHGGTLCVEEPGATHRFGESGELNATLVVHDERFFLRALTASDIGIGESFMDGDWTTPDLVPLVRLMLRSRRAFDGRRSLLRAVNTWRGAIARRLRDNSLDGSRRHIHRHYDLGNDFFRLFLDSELLMYSCAYLESAADSLEAAQVQKVDRICRALALAPSDRVLEIGSGWGGFAVRAATQYGCHVTTTTISDEQYRHVLEWRSRLGAAGSRIDVLRADYRELTGRFDKMVSIEMFEAVGLGRYDEYFAAVDRLLAPEGAMLLQTITVDDQWFPHYHGTPDWIEKHIFPGGELASVGEILKSLARTTSLSMYHAENIGRHYARTLHAWRARFHRHLDRVRALGFDDRFIRMWDFYLASCEAAFLERHVGLFQMLLVKNGSSRALFNDSWLEAGRCRPPQPKSPRHDGPPRALRRRARGRVRRAPGPGRHPAVSGQRPARPPRARGPDRGRSHATTSVRWRVAADRDHAPAGRRPPDAPGRAPAIDVPVYLGMRNWHPLLPDVLQTMAKDGVRRAIGFVCAAHRSYSSCTQYQAECRRRAGRSRRRGASRRGRHLCRRLARARRLHRRQRPARPRGARCVCRCRSVNVRASCSPRTAFRSRWPARSDIARS